MDRENSNKIKQEEGILAVAKIKAQALNVRLLIYPSILYSTLTSPQTQADADAYQTVAAARAQAQSTQIAADAEAEATRLAARADADAIRLRAAADGDVQDTFARGMEMRRVEVQRVRAFGNRTVFVPATGGFEEQVGGGVATGYGAAVGAAQGR